jgi:hypothetical protein
MKTSHILISCLCLFTHFDVSKGESFGVTESRKSASVIYAMYTCLSVPPHVKTEEPLKELSRNISTQLILFKIGQRYLESKLLHIYWEKMLQTKPVKKNELTFKGQ